MTTTKELPTEPGCYIDESSGSILDLELRACEWIDGLLDMNFTGQLALHLKDWEARSEILDDAVVALSDTLPDNLVAIIEDNSIFVEEISD